MASTPVFYTPTPKEIIESRERAGLTQKEAAELGVP